MPSAAAWAEFAGTSLRQDASSGTATSHSRAARVSTITAPRSIACPAGQNPDHCDGRVIGSADQRPGPALTLLTTASKLGGVTQQSVRDSDAPGPVAALIFQMPSSASRAARWPASTAPSIYPLQALAVSVAAHLIGPIGSLSAAPKWSRPHGPMFEL